jgi:hypothetical protein
MDYTKITSHIADAKDRLLYQFRRGTSDISDLLATFSDRYQGMENVLYDLYFYLNLDNAYGELLDKIGVEHNMPRPITGLASTDDNAYRLLIKAKIAANTSDGLREDIYNILGILGASNIWLQNIYPATIQINYTGISESLIIPSELSNLLESGTQPISINISNYHETEYFAFFGCPGGAGFSNGYLGSSK